MNKKVFLSIGSNKGDREQFLLKGYRKLSKILTGIRISSIYETTAQDVTGQSDFLNAVVSGYFEYEPGRLLSEINAIEKFCGRDRSVEQRKGPRTLDIDILLFEDVVINKPELVIPHIRMKMRQFILIPLLEISPEIIDPDSGIPFIQYSKKLGDQGVRIKSKKSRVF